MRSVLIAAIVLLVAASAHAQFNGCSAGFCPGTFGGGFGPAGGGVAAPQPTGKILMVDAASFILQTDGTSKICRAGGC